MRRHIRCAWNSHITDTTVTPPVVRTFITHWCLESNAHGIFHKHTCVSMGDVTVTFFVAARVCVNRKSAASLRCRTTTASEQSKRGPDFDFLDHIYHNTGDAFALPTLLSMKTIHLSSHGLICTGLLFSALRGTSRAQELAAKVTSAKLVLSTSGFRVAGMELSNIERIVVENITFS